MHRRGHVDSLLDEKRMRQWSISHCADCGRSQQLSSQRTLLRAVTPLRWSKSVRSYVVARQHRARNGVSLCHSRPEAYHGVILGRWANERPSKHDQ